jgi:hypothetical protein
MTDTKKVASTPKSPDPKLNRLESLLDRLTFPTRGNVHVNGSSYYGAYLVVDFGEPLNADRLKSEEAQELISLMRSTTKDMLGRDGQVQVTSDQSRGVYWANVTMNSN